VQSLASLTLFYGVADVQLSTRRTPDYAARIEYRTPWLLLPSDDGHASAPCADTVLTCGEFSAVASRTDSAPLLSGSGMRVLSKSSWGMTWNAQQSTAVTVEIQDARVGLLFAHSDVISDVIRDWNRPAKNPWPWLDEDTVKVLRSERCFIPSDYSYDFVMKVAARTLVACFRSCADALHDASSCRTAL
jgi:hypothetical protein